MCLFSTFPVVHALPIVTWTNQSPADLLLFNTFNVGLNITYFMFDNAGLPNSSIRLLYNINHSVNNCHYFFNGTYQLCGYRGIHHTYNSSDQYLFRLFDNQILPATYLYNETVIENTLHSVYNLTSSNQLIKLKFYNFSNNEPFTFYEIMANSTGTQSLRIIYCNSSYVSGNPFASPYCVQMANLLPSDPYNHTHTVYSRHKLMSVPVNATTGTLNGIVVSSTSYVILVGRAVASTWSIHYVPAISMGNTVQVSNNNGVTYTDLGLGVPDTHFHQLSLDEKLCYFGQATNYGGEQVNSTERCDLLNLSGIPPSLVTFVIPLSGNRSFCNYDDNSLRLTWTQAVSPNQYPIYYNVSLRYANDSLAEVLIANNSINTTFYWVINVSNEEYNIHVTTCDTFGLCSTSESEDFRVQGCEFNSMIILFIFMLMIIIISIKKEKKKENSQPM